MSSHTASASAAIHEAIAQQRTDVLCAVLAETAKHGDLGKVLEFGPERTALQHAVDLGNADLVRTLLSAGADVSLLPGTTLDAPGIQAAFMAGFLQGIAGGAPVTRVQQYLDAGAVGANATDGGVDKNTPLHWAVAFAGLDTTKLLLAAGADPNAVNSNGGTPLHDACKRGDQAIVSALLAAGARNDIVGTGKMYAEKRPSDMTKDEALRALVLTPQSTAPAVPTDSLAPAPSPAMELDPELSRLFPVPKHISQFPTDQTAAFPDHPTVSIAALSREVQHLLWPRVEHHLALVGRTPQRAILRASTPANISLLLDTALLRRPQEYRLSVESGLHIAVVAADVDGLRAALQTIVQLLALYEKTPLPRIRVTDWPDLVNRAYMLDVSRDKVPRLATLYDLVDLLELLRYNQLQLYMEHTFQYSEHKVVWQDAGAYSSSDMLALSEYCRLRGISLVPNQNSFGHFDRFLMHDRYKHLAECPDGIDFGPRPSGVQTAPFSLCPIDPRSLALVESLYEELFPHFPDSSLVHVGLDETFDLGRGRSQSACKEQGMHAVYMKFFHQIQRSVQAMGRTTMFWADILQGFDESVLLQVPANSIAMEWGYEDDHPFEENCTRLRNAGIPFYVCPGTSSWNSLVGRTANSIGNIRNACLAATALGGLGMLLTDWGDFGHLQPLAVSYPSIVAGAGFSWNAHQKPFESDALGALVDQFAFPAHVAGLGGHIVGLGNVYTQLGGGKRGQCNGTALFRAVVFTGRTAPRVPHGVTPNCLRVASLAIKQHTKALHAIQQTLLAGCDVWQTIHELLVVADLALIACHVAVALLRAGRQGEVQGAAEDDRIEVATLPVVVRTDLANKLLPVVDRFRQNWPVRNHPEGCDTAMKNLQHTIDTLLNGVFQKP